MLTKIIEYMNGAYVALEGEPPVPFQSTRSVSINFRDSRDQTHHELEIPAILREKAVYPLMMMVKQDPALAMMMSLYATLGVFLLLAARNPSEHRSLIAFTAWSSFAHAALMAVQAFLNLIPRRELVGVVGFILIGVALIALPPAKQPAARVSAAVA